MMKKRFKLFSFAFAANIIFNATIFAQSPSQAAPDPTTTAGPKVISIYSNAYTNITGTNFNPYWQQTTQVTTVSVSGNATMKYTNFNYQGIELGSEINALPMTHFHIDVWTSNETSMTIAPVSHGGTNQAITLQPLNLNQWNSFDIALADVKDKWVYVSDIFQLFLQGSGGKTVFIDNMYFYNNMVGDDTEGPTEFTAIKGAVTFNTVELILNAKDNSGAVNYEITKGTDKIKLSVPSGTQKSYTFSQLTPATQYSFSVSAKDFMGNTAANSPITLSVTTNASPSAAPTPPARPAYKVVSILGDAYSNIGGTNFYPNWQQKTKVSTTQFSGNEVMVYEDLNYQGMELGSEINALPMTHFHIDIWTANENSVNITPISRSGTNSTISLTPLNLNQWNSFDIPLANFSNEWKYISDIFQFKMEGSGGKTIYFDNMYFYNSSTVEDTIKPTGITVSKGAVTFGSIELLLNASDNSGAVNFEISYGIKKDIVSCVSGKTKSYTISSLRANTDYNFTIVANDGPGNVCDSTVMLTIKTLAPAIAPIPTADPLNVISIFSDTYGDLDGTNFNPFWSQATVMSTIKLSGNSVLSYANLNYQGTELGTHIDASKMTHFHVDVWTADETKLEVTVISPGKEKLVTLSPLKKNVWNSYNVPLTSFTDVDMSDLFQLKFQGSGGKTVYLDNIYLYNSNAPTAILKEEKVQLSVYPNPVSDLLKIESAMNINKVIVRNTAGQIVTEKLVYSASTSLNMKNLPKGLYLVSIIQNEKTTVHKILK